MDIFNKQILELFLSRTGKSRAQCSKLYDIDGHEYVDFFCRAGTVLLGHRSPVILEVVESALISEDDFSAVGRIPYKPPSVAGKEMDLEKFYKNLQAVRKLYTDAGKKGIS